jgi:predicted nucleotidyltransferase
VKKRDRKGMTGRKACLWNLPRGWVHQGFFYLDHTQRLGRVILEIVPTVLLAALVGGIGGIPLSSIWLWGGSLLIAHTLNWVFNGNWWAGLLFAFPQLRNRGDRATCAYLNRMADRLRHNRSISGVMIFGSAARGQWHERSDLDLRLLRRRGLANGIAGVLVLVRERWIALWARQPLDVYLADDVAFLRHMRQDEAPIFLKKDDPRLERAYPEGRETRVETLTMSPLHAGVS